MIGKMRDRIVIQQSQRIDVPGGGGVSSWVSVLSVWAEAIPLTSNLTLQDNQSSLRDGYRFNIRYTQPAPSEGMRVAYKGHLYLINSVIEVNARERFWQITATTNSYPVS